MAPSFDAAARTVSLMLSLASCMASDPPPVQLVGASASLAAVLDLLCAVLDLLWALPPAAPNGWGPEADGDSVKGPVTLCIQQEEA